MTNAQLSRESIVDMQKRLKEYSNLTKDEKIALANPNISQEKEEPKIYYYKLEGQRNLKEKFTKYIELSLVDLFSIETMLDKEQNPIIKMYLSMVLDGSEPETILKNMSIKKEWMVRSYRNLLSSKDREKALKTIEDERASIIKNFENIAVEDASVKRLKTLSVEVNNWLIKVANLLPSSEKFKNYVDEFELEFGTLIQGVLSTQKGDTPEIFLEKLRFEVLKESPKRPSQKNRYANVIEMSKEIVAIQKEIEVFNTQMDSLCEKIVLENPSELIARLVNYATMARMDELPSLYKYSIDDKNSFLREQFQKEIFKIEPKQTKEELLNRAKEDGYSDEFLFEYERELTTISLAVESMKESMAPRMVENLLLSLYVDKNLKSVFD